MKRRSGTISIEYMLILALVVIPIAAMYPMFISMIRVYASRMTWLVGLPVP